MTAAVDSLTPHYDDAPPAEAPASSGAAWWLFLSLNATLFMRPAEIVPQLEGLPIYEINILLCLLLSLPAILRNLQPRSPNPITLCVLGVLPGIIISLLANGDSWSARHFGIEFIKIILYYLLLVTLVDSSRRLRQFLLILAIYALLLNTVALLSYHQIIDLTTVAPMEEGQSQIDPETGERVIVVRLQAAGIYGNPNDLARIIVVGIVVSMFAISGKRRLPVRLLWLGALAVFIYALQLTFSRGGLLALLAGILILFHARYGMRRGGALVLLLLPLMVVFDGRQTDIDTSSGTGQLRIKLWSEGLKAMGSAPLFGIGTDRFKATAGNHAHNSFVEAYVEMGFFGGTFFACAFIVATTALYRLKSDELRARDPELGRVRPYLLALVVGTIVGQFSSSREYSLPTYMILGLATVYLSLAAKCVPELTERVTPGRVVRLTLASACTLLVLHLYTVANAHFG